MQELTIKQKLVLNAIKELVSEKNSFPTLVQIGAKLGITSRSGVHYHLEQLISGGYLSKVNSRGYKLVEDINFTSIPLLGRANAGLPLIEAVEDYCGNLQVDSRFIVNSGNLFAVKISGDSMDRQMINKNTPQGTVYLKDGNFAIIDKDADYSFGDIILAIIDGCATIKILKKTDTSIVLCPNSSNTKHQPIFVKDSGDLFINGKVVLALDNPK